MAITKTYGTLIYKVKTETIKGQLVEKSLWSIESAQPHVCIKLKALFPQIRKSSVPPFEFPATDEHAHNLLWFMKRYPMEVSEEHMVMLSKGEQQRIETINDLESILLPDYHPQTVRLVEGHAARDYQLKGHEFHMKVKRFLLGDAIGLGKTVTAILSFLKQEHRPVAVVVQTHLTRQWKDEIIKFTGLNVHIVKTRKAYNLPPADVYIFKYTSLSGWVDLFGTGFFKNVVFDEPQELRHQGTNKYDASTELALHAELCCGMSVCGDSIIELYGWKFGDGYIGSIEEATNIAFSENEILFNGQYEYVDVINLNIFTRGWDGERFSWKRVNKFISHANNKQLISFKIQGLTLSTTEDHSIYHLNNNGIITCNSANKLKVNDIVPVDNGNEYTCNELQEIEIDCLELLKDNEKAQVILDYRHIGRRTLDISISDWNNYRIKGEYGDRLPLSIYMKNIDKLPVPKYVYIGVGKNKHIPTDIKILPSNLAFILGFWLGNGWIDNSRVCFAVKESYIDRFLEKIKEIKHFKLKNIEVVKTKGASYEVRISNIMLSYVLLKILGKVKASTKKIPPHWIFTWNKESKLQLIEGLINSDGSVSKKKKYISYTTISKELCTGIVYLLKSIGISSGIYCHKAGKGGIINGRKITGLHPVYRIHWSSFEERGRFGSTRKFESSTGVLKEGIIREVSNYQQNISKVYDLEVNGHPSFVCNNVLVHNSATPIYNYGDEIFNIMNVIYPYCLGTEEAFLREWCEGFGNKVRVTDPQALGTYLRESLLMLRRTRADVGRELPPVNKIIYTIDADEEIMDKDLELAKQLAIQVTTGSFTERGQASRNLDALVRHATGVAKAKSAAAYVKIILESGEKVVLGLWHRAVIDIMMHELQEFNPVMYTGSESSSQKEKSKQDFINGNAQVMLLSLRSGAGLDGLQSVCKYVVFAELDYSPAAMNQFIGRIDRDTNEVKEIEEVTAIYLVSDSGSDPIMIDILGLKASQQHGIINPLTSAPQQYSDESRIKLLAQQYLDKK